MVGILRTYTATVRRKPSVRLEVDPNSMTGVEPAPTASTPTAGSPVVQKRSMSGRSKLLAASFVVDAIVIAIVLYVILR